jgi:hypothetical protein
VERLFPVNSPNIESIVLHKVGKVNRAKLFYLRERSGKSARIKEKKILIVQQQQNSFKRKPLVSVCYLKPL